MIVRGYIKCGTCGHPHMPRVQVGVNPSQIHVFNCLNCNEPIKLALNADEKKFSVSLVAIENCNEIGEIECTPVYLCADFTAHSDQINERFSFPSMNLHHVYKDSKIFEDMCQLASGENKFHAIHDDWSLLEKIWRLINSDKLSIANPLISEFAKDHKREDATFPELLWYFLNTLFPLNDELHLEIESIAKTNQSEFGEFLKFYKKELKRHHRRSQFDIMSAYFKAYDQHSQVMMYIRLGTPISEIGKATLVEFDKVKAFYASAYEFFSGEIAIYTCLNNIKEGRKYDQLKHITLKKYLETDKAKRRDSILANTAFATATEEFDSVIRNGSFHNWFFLHTDNEKIEIRSGGTGALKEITYTEYLYHCGMMFKQLCQLFAIELALDKAIISFGL